MDFNTLDEALKDYPDGIVHSIKMSEPNEDIPIYKGNFELRGKDFLLSVTGEISFSWFPKTVARFKGTVNQTTDDLRQLFTVGARPDLQVFIAGLVFGNCIISNINISQERTLEGYINGDAVLGDKSISVSKIKFHLPNFIDLKGISTKSKVEDGINVGPNRLEFTNEEFKIILDKNPDFDNASKQLDAKGGYMSLYNGEITKTKGSISFSDMQSIVYCLFNFLSFVNGKRCSPIFLQGIHEDEVIWTDYTNRFIDQHKTISTWIDRYDTLFLNEIWQNFTLLWKEENHKNFLITAVHWYIEANAQSGFCEGSIIMAQTDLELLYNWLIVETTKLLLGKDAESISASNKIRLLLSHISVNNQIPEALAELKSNTDYIDGPEAIVQIRNALVHGQEEKRKKLILINDIAKFEVLNLATLYIELAILYILRYKGCYIDRCERGGFVQNKIKRVPWVQIV